MRQRDIDPEKLLEMIRSILPSRARDSARLFKAHERRAVRRGIHQALHTEDAEETAVDLEADADQSQNVRARRAADKLNHFMRWCESLTEGLSGEEAIDFVRGILPDNLIGDHALSHWESHCKYRRSKRQRVPARERRARLAQSFYDRTRTRLATAMSEDPDFLARFNQALKARRTLDYSPRLLHGVHEIDDYVGAVVVHRYGNGQFLWPSHELYVLFEMLNEHARQSGPKRPVTPLKNPR